MKSPSERVLLGAGNETPGSTCSHCTNEPGADAGVDDAEQRHHQHGATRRGERDIAPADAHVVMASICPDAHVAELGGHALPARAVTMSR